MTSHKRVAPANDPETALLKGVAMDIGKEVVAYIERMYPNAVNATSSTFRLAVRNTVYNEIIAAMKVTNPDKIKERLAANAKNRREMRRLQSRINETDWEAVRANPNKQAAEIDDIKTEWFRDENFPKDRTDP